MAARRLTQDEKLLDILAAEGVEGYEVRSRREGEAPERSVLADVAPGRFVTRVGGEGGEVRVAPMVEALLKRLRERRRTGGPGT